jgi:glycine hydroxymethyltransferase
MKDEQISQIISKEEARLSSTINLVASENYASRDVKEALGSIFVGEYAEGRPMKRYYEGRENIDELESLVRDRAKKLFHAEHVNVQPYSGSVANFAIYNALLKPGDTIMGLELSHGGHLSHGWKVTVSAKYFRSVQYGLDPETKRLDYDAILKLAQKEKPKIIISGYSAYSQIIDFKQFAEIAKEVGAYHMADISHIAGLVAAGVHPSPLPYADVVMTTTHKTLRGPRGAMIMCKKELADLIDKSVFPGIQGGPHENTIAAIGVALREAAQPEFKEYAKQIVANAKVLADALKNLDYDIVSGGTENHLMLVDLTKKGITGGDAGTALIRAGINVNRNSVPFDTKSPFNPSGIRMGTAAATTRGMQEEEMNQIAVWMDEVLKAKDKKTTAEKVRAEVEALCKQFPLP